MFDCSSITLRYRCQKGESSSFNHKLQFSGSDANIPEEMPGISQNDPLELLKSNFPGHGSICAVLFPGGPRAHRKVL